MDADEETILELLNEDGGPPLAFPRPAPQVTPLMTLEIELRRRSFLEPPIIEPVSPRYMLPA